MNRRYRKGFTLIEIMVVIAIIGIVLAIAVPNYVEHVTRSKINEAVSTLSNLHVQLEQYYQDNRNYGPNANCGSFGANTVPSSATGTVKYFTYTCATTTTTTSQDGYLLTATGVTSTGMSGFSYTIDQNNNKASNVTASGWSNPSPNNCWTTRKGGSC